MDENVARKISEIEQKTRHYRWLKEIADKYNSMLEYIRNNKECFTVQSFWYTMRGDAREFELNPHHSINPIFIRLALQAAIKEINKELEKTEKEISGLLQ